MPKSRHSRRRSQSPPAPKRLLVNLAPDEAARAQAEGIAAFERRDDPAAISAFEKAIRVRPADPVIRTQLGTALRAAGRTADAILCYRAALELSPGLAMAHNNLGNALRESGDPRTALEHLKEATRLNPEYTEAHHNLALTLLVLDRSVAAERACARALQLKPDYPDALGTMAQLLSLKSDFDGAAEAAAKAIALAPRNPSHRLSYASILQANGRFDEADREIAVAAALVPHDPEVQFLVGRSLEQQGDEHGAAAAYRRVIAAQPHNAGPYLSLANFGPDGLSDEELASAEGLVAAPHLHWADRSTFAFGIARAYEKRKDYDRAFAWVRFANELERQRSRYDEAESLAFVERSIATFPAGYLASASIGPTDARPIFIVGFPRSGTTLVEQIIASHPEAAAGGELVDIPDLTRELPLAMGVAYPECVAEIGYEKGSELAARYLARLDRVDAKALRVTDKLPFNFRNLGLISRLLPGARVIHCRRDPRDVAVSCYFIKFHRPISFAQSLFDFGAYWRQYERLMEHWREALPLPMLEVDYETIVAEPEAQIRRIIDFAGLPWDPRCLRFFESKAVVRTASTSQIRNPIYSGSVGRWRRYAKHLAPLYSELYKDNPSIRAATEGSTSAVEPGIP